MRPWHLLLRPVFKEIKKMFPFNKKDRLPYSVERIAAGELLDKALERDPHSFFKHWMRKRPRKAMVGTWFVLYQNEGFVYWGSPVFKRLFSDKRVVEKFYKTPRKALEEVFPDYEKKDGNAVRLRLLETVRKALPPSSGITLGMGDFAANLSDEHIIATVNCRVSPPFTPDTPNPEAETVRFKVVLDKGTLKALSCERIDS